MDRMEQSEENRAEDRADTVARPGRRPAATGLTFAAAFAAAALIAAAVGYLVPGKAPSPADAPHTTSAQPPQDDGTARTAASAAASTEAAPSAPVPAATALPRFDMLRATPDGMMTVAGVSTPRAQVEVLLDGRVVDTVQADAGGRFASVTLGTPAAVPRMLTLRSTGSDGAVLLSSESLTVAPSPASISAQASGPQSEAAQGSAGLSTDSVDGASPQASAALADQIAQAGALAQKPLVTDGAGVRVLAGQSATLVIDTLALAVQGGSIDLTGRGAPAGALLRAYVDDAEAGLVAAGPEGHWRMVLPAPAPGGHQLRIDALDAAGKVLARAETRFETLSPDALSAADEAARLAPSTAPPSGATPSTATPAAAEDGVADGGPAVRMVTVEEGYTLWAIAERAYGDPKLYVRVFEANRDQIRDPDRIYPGQVVTLPKAAGQ